ncbi:hypothetical protein SYNPS1DRAFT_5426, partial [Syncephalis pseudoplumigaleata]
VNVASLDYIRGLEKLLKETAPMTLHWYLVWRVIMVHGTSLDRETALLVRELGALVDGVHSKIEPRRHGCITWMEQSFAPLIARYFVAQQSSGMAMEAARNVTEQLRETFITRARELDWLDNATRDKVVEKVMSSILKIGAPTYPNTESATDLDAYYASYQMNATHHFENVLAYERFSARQQYLKIGQAVHPGEWLLPASSVNMYYSRFDNAIVVPAGILQPPFYSHDHPSYYNYGSLGMFIAHELSHAFDDRGRKFDATGQLHDWWTKGTSNEFNKKAECFQSQYARYTVDGPDGARLRVNGALTLSEIMA